MYPWANSVLVSPLVADEYGIPAVVSVLEATWKIKNYSNRSRMSGFGRTVVHRFELLLAAGSFGTEITSPVMWLIEEYGMDITCTRIEAYEHQGRILLNSQQVIPVSEAEEYMTKRREKQEKQESSSQRRWTLPVLLERGVLVPGDVVTFTEDRVPMEAERDWNPEDDFWLARITGDTGQQNTIEWLHDGSTYSFTGLAKEILQQLVGRDPSKALNGYKYWCHPEFDDRTLNDLRESEVSDSAWKT